MTWYETLCGYLVIWNNSYCCLNKSSVAMEPTLTENWKKGVLTTNHTTYDQNQEKRKCVHSTFKAEIRQNIINLQVCRGTWTSLPRIPRTLERTLSNAIFSKTKYQPKIIFSATLSTRIVVQNLPPLEIGGPTQCLGCRICSASMQGISTH